MGLNLNVVNEIVTMYLSSNDETKQEIKNVIVYLEMINKKIESSASGLDKEGAV